MGYLVGAITVCNGIFNAYVMKVHPAFKSGQLSASTDPYATYTAGSAEALAYVWLLLSSHARLGPGACAGAIERERGQGVG